LITLTFRPIDSQPPVLVRGRFFRICADGTLRGPDNDVTAMYADGVWALAHRQHRAIECGGSVYLRVTHSNGRREQGGPYESVRAADGAIYTHDHCMGIHASGRVPSGPLELWREVVLLSEL
jgi:hypothetical protein